MRKLLIILFCLAAKAGCPQAVKPILIKADTTVVNAYDKAIAKLPVNYQSEAGKFQDAVIFTLYKVDTLNKEDLKDKSKTGFGDLNTRDEVADSIDPGIYIPLQCSAELMGSFLLIEAPQMRDRNQFIPGEINSTFGIEVFKQKEYASYSGYYIEKIKDMIGSPALAAKVLKFKISTLNFKLGQLIYGEVELKIGPHYNYSNEFKSGQIMKKLHCKYVFKAIIEPGRPVEGVTMPVMPNE